MQLGNWSIDETALMTLLEKLCLAALALLVTWLLANAAKWAFAKLVDNVGFLQRDTSSGMSLGASLGKIVSMIIWLFGLLIVLQLLGLGSVVGPIDNLLDEVAGVIPSIVGAAVIFFIGLVVARILRDVVVTALQTVDFDKWANRGGVDDATGNTRISSTIGAVLYGFVVLLVSIAALDTLNIAAISEPASNMLGMILNAIPNVLVASILIGIGYLVGEFVANLATEILPGLGVDRALSEVGIVKSETRVSTYIARGLQIAIILFFAIAATRMLGFPELTSILNAVLELGGQVVFGGVVIAVGFLIANVLSRFVAGSDQSTTASNIVRWAAIILFTFMGLRFMGVGEEIVQTAFSAIVIGGAVAGALAFGLGGRNWAERKLEQLDKATPATKPIAEEERVTEPASFQDESASDPSN